MINMEEKINLIRGYVDVLEDTTGWDNIYEQAPGLEAMMVLITKLLEDTANYMENFEHIGTVENTEIKLNDLKSGDMIYVVRRK